MCTLGILNTLVIAHCLLSVIAQHTIVIIYYFLSIETYYSIGLKKPLIVTLMDLLDALGMPTKSI
ncbi:hypothetical protein MUK42_37047 [Musa troglodytarum]|uniref:Uncharacterized protein n=1 Tax=Musa troglodytarum TaxID=320322 RepID=A0A9E7HAC8_9LILI|nr:hypothetical protein MUK42_37047 [Musa troglodytarum]